MIQMIVQTPTENESMLSTSMVLPFLYSKWFLAIRSLVTELILLGIPMGREVGFKFQNPPPSTFA